MNQILKQTELKTKCDAAIKKLLGDPYIVSILIKLSLPDVYDSFSVQEIKDRYVIDKVNIGDIPIDQDDEILKLNSEDSSLMEGNIYYDVLTLIKKPETKKGMYLNIEGQNNSHPGYDLINRGLYYLGRIFSRQKNLIWFKSDYDGLLKVVSLWICTKPDKEAENTIQRIHLNYEEVVGTLKKKKEVYDKAEILMIQLGKDADRHENALLRFLGILLSSKFSAEEKIEYLRNEFHIEDNKLKRTVNGMCNLSTGYFDEGREIGFSEGKISGFNEGKISGFNEGEKIGFGKGQDSTTILLIKNLVSTKKWTIDEAMNALCIPDEKRAYYALECEEKLS